MSEKSLQLPPEAQKLLSRPAAKAAFDESRQVAEICRTLARARKESRMSQEDLAAASGIPQAEISRMESGMLSRGPTLLTLVRLARAMQQNLLIAFEKSDAASPGVVTVVAHTVPGLDAGELVDEVVLAHDWSTAKR
jgi:transcriptional regulator with XRE-family HTH domain